MEDYSGKITIVAFDSHGNTLNELMSADKEYFVSKTNDPNGISASINNNGYKLEIVKV